MYVFAHDSSSNGMIQAGNFTTDGSGVAEISLGWEPQYVMVKRTNSTGNWYLQDSMRGGLISNGTAGSATLSANSLGIEAASISQTATADGFTFQNSGVPGDYIYLAIRKPMKTPTSSSEVFAVINSSSNVKAITNFPVDFSITSILT